MARPRLGLAGVGALGSRHARVLAEQAQATGEFAFAGVYDLRRERAQEVAAQHGTTAHASFDALCEASDGILVVVPTVAHAEVAVRAIELGRDVFVEKPIADSLAAA